MKTPKGASERETDMYKNQEKLTVLITGAAAGIGKAVADVFLEKGNTVYALDVHTPLCGIPLTADITDENALCACAEQLQKDGVALDAIFNFAGVHTVTSFIEGDLQRVKRLMEINVLGAMFVNKCFLIAF